MIKFNPENKENLSRSEALDPAIKVKTKEEAQAYLNGYIAYIERKRREEKPNDGLTAEQVAMRNIGYWTGYFDNAEEIKALFGVRHPILG